LGTLFYLPERESPATSMSLWFPRLEFIAMPKDRRKVRENKRKYKGLKRGTYRRRPTVKIPDPTAWGVPLGSNWPKN